MKKKNLVRFWTLVWGLGIVGQLCWNVENQWFNTFVYAKIAMNPTIISWMVAVSAITTTISTFLFGTLSDRAGQRKPYVGAGYILWGIFTIIFGFTQYIPEQSAGVKGIMAASIAVVVADAVMSFFGSMGSDSAYNAWLNDNMNEANRGGIGAALAAQPVIGTIAGTVAGGLLIGSDDNYMRLFIVMGGAVIIFGLLTFVFMKDSPDLKPHREGSFWQQFGQAFNFKKLKVNKELIWVFLTLMIYFTAFDVYYPHLGNFLIYYLGFDAGSIGIMEGAALLIGMLVVVPAAKLINQEKYSLAATISILLSAAGVLVIGLFVTPQSVNTSTILNWNILIALVLFGLGYVMFMQVLSVWMKSLFPQDAKGQFEGFRIVFFVLLPWLISPFISNPVIMSTGRQVSEAGTVSYLPTPVLFRISCLLILLTFIPLIPASRARKSK